MNTKKPRLSAEHLAFRVPPDIMPRLDALADAMSSKHVVLAFHFSRSEAARAALLGGLAPLEREYGLVEPGVEPPQPVVDRRTGRPRKTPPETPKTTPKTPATKGGSR